MQRVASLDSVSRDSTREAWSEAAAAAHTSIDDNALPFELRHALYDTLVDTRLRTRLLRELLPVRNMVLFFNKVQKRFQLERQDRKCRDWGHFAAESKY
uniref:Uncharacterized protein n=1 Tax=Tetraselmis sp. GSL018 TaxID=582737 RepID=A0A061R4P6_9CHLO